MVTIDRALAQATPADGTLDVAATVLGVKPFHFQTALEPKALQHNPEEAVLIFFSPNQIVAGAPVKLETEYCLWLGHVVECRSEGDVWRTQMCIEHSLTNLPELLQLAARFE